jgi:hypothetical protein
MNYELGNAWLPWDFVFSNCVLEAFAAEHVIYHFDKSLPYGCMLSFSFYVYCIYVIDRMKVTIKKIL